MKITIRNTQKDLSIQPLKKAILHLAPLIVEKETHSLAVWSEVTFQFVTAPKISSLHADFFNDPTITDCITFPMDTKETPPPRILGEVFICPKVAIEYAKKHAGNPYHETLLYIVHGLLHLLGYDDIEAQDRKLMRQKERTYMKLAQYIPAATGQYG